MVLGGFGSFWLVLGGYEWFRVLVTTDLLAGDIEYLISS